VDIVLSRLLLWSLPKKNKNKKIGPSVSIKETARFPETG